MVFCSLNFLKLWYIINMVNESASKNIKFPKELDQLCIAVGRFIQYWGFKEIEGRIWCHILLSKRALCAKDLMNRTGVSKGLVSISLKRLLEYNVIREEFVIDGKIHYYQVNENITQVIKDVLRNRERKIITEILACIELVSELPKAESKGINTYRLEYLKKIVRHAQLILKTLIFTQKSIQNFFFNDAPVVEKNIQ